MLRMQASDLFSDADENDLFSEGEDSGTEHPGRLAAPKLPADGFRLGWDGFRLAKYLERIGAAEHPCAANLATLEQLMEGQMRSIAFENIDVVCGRTVSIDPRDVEQKLVEQGRGGYCFEQNILLLCALLSIGFDAVPLLCRVRYLKPAHQLTAFTHLALRVTLPDGGRYLADVGFAGTNSVAPVRLGTDELQELPEGQFRVRCFGGYNMLQRQLPGDELRDLYMFRGEDVATMPDLEQSNWFSCTFPESRFCSSFFVSRLIGDKKHHILNDQYVVRSCDGATDTTQVSDSAHLSQLLNDVFGLHIPAETQGVDRYL